MDDRGLLEICAALSEARRSIAAGRSAPLAALPALLAASLRRHAPTTLLNALVPVLDELMGLIGQLELERADALARLEAFERHRRARRSYSAGRAAP
ncbi:MAG: hypothetical protein U1E52_13620 [Geminicoccaceae bacterium]